VSFSVPVLESSTTAPINNRVAEFVGTAQTAAATTVAQVQPLATSVTNGLQVVNSAGSFTLPVGNYLVSAGVVFSNNGSNCSATLQLQKNGTLYGIIGGAFDASATIPMSITLPTQFISNSTASDIWTVVATATYSTGTVTYSYGKLNILSI